MVLYGEKNHQRMHLHQKMHSLAKIKHAPTGIKDFGFLRSLPRLESIIELASYCTVVMTLRLSHNS